MKKYEFPKPRYNCVRKWQCDKCGKLFSSKNKSDNCHNGFASSVWYDKKINTTYRR